MAVYYVKTRVPSPWAASFFITKAGKRLRRISYHQTKRAAWDAYSAAQVAIKEQTFASARDALRFDALCDQFLAVKRPDVRATTAADYASLVEMYLRPYFNDCTVRDIARADVEALKSALLTRPPRAVVEARFARYAAGCGGNPERWHVRAAEPVGRRTVAAALALLRLLLSFAVELRAATYNAAAGVRKRGGIRSAKVDAAHVLTVPETRRLLEVAPDEYRPLIRFAVETGLREGELFGLQWGDLDFGAGLVRVRRQWRRGDFAELKTAHSQRVVPLTTGLVTEMKRWKLRCPISAEDLVFPNKRGRPHSGSNFLQRVFYPAFARAGFERAELSASRFRFHQLRHTFATQALAAGITVTEVSRYLGHSSIAVTLNVYAHVMPGGHDAAREKLADLYGALERSKSR